MGEFPSSTRKRKLLLLPTNETKFEFKKIREEYILNKYFQIGSLWKPREYEIKFVEKMEEKVWRDRERD